MNPLNRGMPAQGGGGMPALAPEVTQTIQQIVGMVQRGADFYTIVKALKSKNITPEAVERGLYAVMPQLRQAKQMLAQMGVDPQQAIGQIMKQNNISPDELKGMMSDLASKFTGKKR